MFDVLRAGNSTFEVLKAGSAVFSVHVLRVIKVVLIILRVKRLYSKYYERGWLYYEWGKDTFNVSQATR